jgi:hypothetical protein
MVSVMICDEIYYLRLDGIWTYEYNYCGYIEIIPSDNGLCGKIVSGNCEIYAKYVNNRWIVHRNGGLPAIVWLDDGVIAFYVDGRPMLIEDLDIDEMQKMIMVLKYSRKISSHFHVYDIGKV